MWSCLHSKDYRPKRRKDGLSTLHTLALTNRGGASAEDIARLAKTVQDGVEAAFGIRLVPEPVVIGMNLE